MSPIANVAAQVGMAALPEQPTAPEAAIEPQALEAPGADPLAGFGAMHGLHPDVQAFAFYADKNGSSGAATGTQGTSAKPAPRNLVATTADVYDVNKTSQAVIDDMKTSSDDATRRLGRTIENAKIAYADLLALPTPAVIKVKLSDGNGGQPVMVLTGPGFVGNDQKKPATIHTHYHGDNATVADPLGSKAGTNARIRDAIARDPQTVFVLPEAANTRDGADSPQNDGKFDYGDVGWYGVKSQAATTDDALKAAGVNYRGTQVVSFHSGGGKVVRAIMKADPSGAGLRADRLELHDSLYGTKGHDWSKGPDGKGWEQSFANWAGTANGKAVKQVVYYHGTNEPERQDILKSTYGAKFTPVEISKQGPSAPVNPVYVDADGKTWKRSESSTDKDGIKHKWKVDVRTFEDNPHYRSTGQFLGVAPPPLPPPASTAATPQAIPQVHPGRTDRPQ